MEAECNINVISIGAKLRWGYSDKVGDAVYAALIQLGLGGISADLYWLGHYPC